MSEPTRPKRAVDRPAASLQSVAIHLALTAILAGYFLPWLDHPAAGLTLIGLDLAEWIKFLPQFQSGELPTREIFYLPPVMLGGIILFLTGGWENKRWQTWLQRGIGVAVACLAFPSFDAIRFEPAGEWLPRLLMIGLVVAVALLLFTLPRLSRLPRLVALLVLALLGGGVPAWLFLVLKPILESWLHISTTFGFGFWLNLAGFGFVAALTINQLRRPENPPGK